MDFLSFLVGSFAVRILADLVGLRSTTIYYSLTLLNSSALGFLPMKLTD